MSANTLHYSIEIFENPERVYSLMIDDNTYREWTYVFNAWSHFRGSWEKDSKILFVGCDEAGNEGGMVSRIKENIEGKYISIEHLGELKGGEEITSGPEVDSWAGSLENYIFDKTEKGTFLQVELTIGNTDYVDYFDNMWPKALEKLKEICESD